jgi:hypothetical protein
VVNVYTSLVNILSPRTNARNRPVGSRVSALAELNPEPLAPGRTSVMAEAEVARLDPELRQGTLGATLPANSHEDLKKYLEDDT